MLVAATDEERTRAGLESAAAAGVLEVVGDSVRFAHPLLAAATYGRATLERRRKVHERLAEIVTDPEGRARHLARTATGPDESIAAALEDGAAAAQRRGAPEVAAELSEEAARLTPTDAPDERRRRLMVAAEHLAVSGDIGRAGELLAGISAELRDGPLRAEVLTRRAHLALILGELDVAETHLRDAIPMSAGDGRLQVQIHSGLAGIGDLSWRGWRRARLHMFEALAQAKELGDPGLELQMLGHTATWTQALGRPWRGLLERADALHVPIADVPLLEHPDLQFARILANEGDVDAARRRIEGLVERARSIGDWTSLPRLLVTLAIVEVEAGLWDRAERVAADAYTGLLQTGQGAFYQQYLTFRLHLEVQRGRADEARALWAEIEPVTSVSAFPEFRAGTNLAIARLDLWLGDWDRAHARLTRIIASLGRAKLVPVDWEMIVADQAEALLGLGRKDEARDILDPVERRARRRGIPAAIGEVVRARALVLAAEGEDAAAVEAAKEAVRIHAGLQVPFRTARAMFTLGEVLRRSRQKAASRAAFETALGLFTRLGAQIWIDRAQAELGRVASRRPAGAALTDTERRVAELAAAGHTNREIAAALFMSVHTVEAHLTRVFRTLGVRTRTELARARLDGNHTGDAGAGKAEGA